MGSRYFAQDLAAAIRCSALDPNGMLQQHLILRLASVAGEGFHPVRPFFALINSRALRQRGLALALGQTAFGRDIGM